MHSPFQPIDNVVTEVRFDLFLLLFRFKSQDLSAEIWLSRPAQNDDRQKERKRPEEGRANSPKTEENQEEEDDNDEEPDNTRQTSENASSGKFRQISVFTKCAWCQCVYLEVVDLQHVVSTDEENITACPQTESDALNMSWKHTMKQNVWWRRHKCVAWETRRVRFSICLMCDS